MNDALSWHERNDYDPRGFCRFMNARSTLRLLPFALLLAAVDAQAQDEGGRLLSLGGGVQVSPLYPGADEVGLVPLPYVDLRREGAPLTFEAPDEGFGFGIVGHDGGFEIGPALSFQGARDEDDVGAPVGRVGFTVEAGAFAQFFATPWLRIRAEGRKGLGGHDGWVGHVGPDLVVRNRDTTIFSIGPRLRLSDDRYQRAYFGVTPAVAAATGLPVHDPQGGIHAWGATAGITHMISPRWGLYGFAGYDRLTGDAADSPIVRSFGSRDQFTAGFAVFHSFGIGRLFDR